MEKREEDLLGQGASMGHWRLFVVVVKLLPKLPFCFRPSFPFVVTMLLLRLCSLPSDGFPGHLFPSFWDWKPNLHLYSQPLCRHCLLYSHSGTLWVMQYLASLSHHCALLIPFVLSFTFIRKLVGAIAAMCYIYQLRGEKQEAQIVTSGLLVSCGSYSLVSYRLSFCVESTLSTESRLSTLRQS